MKRIPPLAIAAIVAIAILTAAAFLHRPYWFYALVRVVVCVASVALALDAHHERRTLWLWTFAAVAITFNPLLPLRMARADWRVLNIIAIIVFCIWLAQTVALWRRSTTS